MIPASNQDHKFIQQTFSFKDFSEALRFVSAVGSIAEELQHHPDISLHGYNNVTIHTTTHEAGTVTDKDTELMNAIEQLFEPAEQGASDELASSEQKKPTGFIGKFLNRI